MRLLWRPSAGTPSTTDGPAYGLTREEIRELLLQTAVSCGVPGANAAFRVAQAVLAEPSTP